MTAAAFMVRVAGLTVLMLVIGVVLAIRIAPMRPERWHVDPTHAHKQPSGNDYLLRPSGASLIGADGVAAVYQGDAATLAHRLQLTAQAEPGTTLLAGGASEGRITLVQRTKWMGYPDAISIWTTNVGPDRSTLAIWSRSRYGENDWGVNRARVERWLDANKMFLIDPATVPEASP